RDAPAGRRTGPSALNPMRLHPQIVCLARGVLLAVALLPVPPGHAQQPAAGGCPIAYVIGPEDVLDIAVWDSPELTRTVPVRPDGKISLPLLNDVIAAGLTPMELRDVLLKKLVDYIPSPEVSVIVTDVRSAKVSVLGAVAHPGRFDLRGRLTVLDALALA